MAGELDGEQRARLLEMADRCPVHRTLTDGAEVTTVLDAGAVSDVAGDHVAAMDAVCGSG